MTDLKQAETSASPAPEVKSTESSTQPVETETNTSNVEESTKPQDDQQVTEDNSKKDAEISDGTQSTATETEEKKPASNKTERRFKKLLDKIKEKDEQLKQYQGETPGEDVELKVEKDDDGNNIIDPENMIKVAEDRAYKRAMQTVRQEQMVKEIQSKANEFLADAEAVGEKISSNPALEKMASKLFEAENYIIHPQTGQKVFVPKRKLSEIVNEITEDLGEYSARAKADLQETLNSQAEESAVRPTESRGESTELSSEERKELLRKNPNKLNKYLSKKLKYAN